MAATVLISLSRGHPAFTRGKKASNAHAPWSAGSAPHPSLLIPPLGRAALAALKKKMQAVGALWGSGHAVSRGGGGGAPLHWRFGGGGRKTISRLTCIESFDKDRERY